VSESLSPWLALREAADHAARSRTLTRTLADALPRGRALRVLDLAAGTGSNLRYLAPLLPVPQEWLLTDIDRELLGEAASRSSSLDGVTVETRQMNLGLLDDAEMFAGRDLVTASALLDLVSESWLQRLAQACRAAGANALFALTYDGRSSCAPVEPEDELVRELMNRHQRQNDKGFGRAAGPDATEAAERAFTAHGYRVRRDRTDWLVPAAAREFQRQLFAGWADAARRMAPDRAPALDAWLARRLGHVDAGRSTVIVGHEDLIALR
jgi:SAM-dependent methyltransferase